MEMIDKGINDSSNVFLMLNNSHGANVGKNIYLCKPFGEGGAQTGTIIH